MPRPSVPVACLLLLAAALVAPGRAAAQAAPAKPRIAVLAFANNSTWSWWGDNLGGAAADEMATQLVQTGKFTVVERAQLGALLAEQDLGTSDRIAPGTAAKIGKVLGVQLLITGSITQFSIERKSAAYKGIGGTYANAESKMDVRLLDTETGEILAVAVGQGNKRMVGGRYNSIAAERTFDQGAAQEALRPAVEQAVLKIAAQGGAYKGAVPTAPAGQITGTKGDRFYINRGEAAGLKVGQRFAVMRVTDEIKDADGRVLDKVIEQVGVIEVTQVLSQSAICKLVSGDAAASDTIK
jgi:curli biogenesis system outer membrane secretion channel CsgG